MNVTWIAYSHLHTAMGVIANNVIQMLDHSGVNISYKVLNTDQNPLDYSLEVQKAMSNEFDPKDSIGIMFSYPDIYSDYLKDFKVKIGYTGCDTDGGYKSERGNPWNLCNACDYMLTPSNYSLKIMKNLGVSVPIELFPHGIDPLIFKPTKRELSNPFTISFTGELTNRKGVPDLMRAFLDVVGINNQDFRLLLRANTHMQGLDSDLVINIANKTNNIQIDWKNSGQSDIVNYMNKSHLFTWISRADWYGLPIQEALACGLPVIATNTNGYYEFFKDMIIPVKTTLREIGNEHPYLLGNWAIADSLDLRQKLYEVINNYYKYAEKAYENSFKIREEFSWKSVTEKYLLPFLDQIDEKYFSKVSTLDRLKKEFKTNERVTMKEKRLTIGIPTKDRGIELALLLQELLNQKFKDFDVIIIDDSYSNLLKENKTLNSLFNLIRNEGHNLLIIEGDKLGPHWCGQRILENSETELILRLDDDVSPKDSNFIDELIKIFDTYPNTAAVGPIYIDPSIPINQQKISNVSREYITDSCKVKWINNDLFLSGWAQINQHPDLTPIQVEHLNSGFMYRREVVEKIGGYFLDFSKVGHREESDLSYRIFREGYNMYICPSAIAWHFHPMFGGIRETLGNIHAKSLWDHDEKLFLERMEKWLPKDKKVLEDSFTSVILLTYGMHEKLRLVLEDIRSYTNHYCELLVINNDPNEDSKKDLLSIAEEFKNISMKLIQLPKELPVSEARNLGVKYTDEKSKYIIMLDDDCRILGRVNQITDWIDYLFNKFHETPDCGAVSPIYTWFEELQCHCVSVACMFTSKRVWNIVGGFDRLFGNKEINTWGYEDCDWSYRCESAGFKLLGTDGGDLPLYHEDTTFKEKTEERKLALLKGKDLILSKYNIGEINKFCRTGYPFTKEQLEIKGLKLNIGSYYMYLDNFINIDINTKVKPNLCCNMIDIDILFSANSVNLILISQCLEHVTKEEGVGVLKKFFNILNHNGYLIVEVPDGNDLIGRLNRNEITKETFDLLTTGHREIEFQGHNSTYKTNELIEILNQIGYVDIKIMPLEMTSDKVESIRIDCIKP